MIETAESLARKLASANDLHGIVRSMKALAVSNISQYELAIRALDGYSKVIEFGLGACFRQLGPIHPAFEQRIKSSRNGFSAIVFGSDHGLVGQFNDVAAAYAARKIADISGKPRIFAVGERMYNRLTDLGLELAGLYAVPHSIDAITPLVGNILGENQSNHPVTAAQELHVFYNKPVSQTEYSPVGQQILPMNDQLRNQWMQLDWPTPLPPEVMGTGILTTRALIREFLFVSVFKSCALSLASENASRLAAMQRADKNIDELIESLTGIFHGLRQRKIDDELFEVISGFEAHA